MPKAGSGIRAGLAWRKHTIFRNPLHTRLSFFLLVLPFAQVACGQISETHVAAAGKTIASRFVPPSGYERAAAQSGSFAEYLQNLPLKPHGTLVKYYNGDTKNRPGVYVAVVNMEIGDRNLQQCADAVMRLRAEYLYRHGKYTDIHFRFTNGDNAAYTQYAEGYRASVSGSRVAWKKSASKDYGYATFRQYLDLVFMYAGTLSLSKELEPVASVKDLRVGDVFIKGGAPGHAVIVVDVARNAKTGRKLFLLAQSYMPAQETQVLQNPDNAESNPWYGTDFEGPLVTPEWTFERSQLKRFSGQ